MAESSSSTKYDTGWKLIVSSIHIFHFFVVRFMSLLFLNDSLVYGLFLNFFVALFFLQVFDQFGIYFKKQGRESAVFFF